MSKIKDKKVLVVDDFQTMRRILCKQLVDLGFTRDNLYEAADGSEALEIIKDHDFDLIISDWNMQPMTGHDLLVKVRQEPRTAKIPFVMVTAEVSPDNVFKAKESGVDNYIAKPFDAQTVRRKVETVFGALE